MMNSSNLAEKRLNNSDINSFNKKNYQFPGYEVFEELGQGGMGIVFRGRQVNMDRIVAIKILKPEYSQQTKIVDNFMREAKTLANLNHNNIIKVITLGQHNGNNYFVMEYVSGKSLQEKLEKEIVLKEKEVLEITLQIAGALEHLNKFGMIHRDIKPSNIILNSQNIPKLSDFGISINQSSVENKETNFTGTSHYISPEQALEKDIDIRSDIYSLGSTLFHLLTGKTPFSGDKSYVIITKHVTEKLTDPRLHNPALSVGVSQLITKMMAKEPTERIQTPTELITALKSILETGAMPIHMRSKTTRRTRANKFATRRRFRA